MILRNILILLATVLLSGCHRYTPPTLAEVRTIQVKVVDSKSDDPISGVKISVSKNYVHKPYLPLASSVLLAEYYSNDKGEAYAPLSLKGSYTFQIEEIGSGKYFDRKIFDPTKNKRNEIVFKINRK